MSPEEQARFKSYHDWTEQYPYYDMYRGYPEGNKKLNQDSFVQTNASVNWMDFDKNQLTWEETQGDKVKDMSEWHDVDFTFTKDHPDWGMDDNVKHYFSVAQQKKQFLGMKFDGDTAEYEAKYRALKANDTKKAELKKAYDWPKNAEEQQRANAEEFGTLEPKKKWAMKNKTEDGETKKEDDDKEKKNTTTTKEDSKKEKVDEEPKKKEDKKEEKPEKEAKESKKDEKPEKEEPAKEDKKKSEEKPEDDKKAKKEKKSEEKEDDKKEDKKEEKKKTQEKPEEKEKDDKEEKEAPKAKKEKAEPKEEEKPKAEKKVENKEEKAEE